MKISYINYKVWRKKFRLKTKTYGGKIEKVCTAFSLKTFLRKTLKRSPFKSFSSQNFQRQQLTENLARKLVHQLALKKQFRYVKIVFSSRNKLLPNSLEISFFNELLDFCARWCKSSARQKGWNDNGSNWRHTEKFKIRTGSLNLAKWPRNTVSTSRAQF